MDFLNRLLSRFVGLFRRREVDGDIDEEMRSHIEFRTQANLDSGMSAEEARRWWSGRPFRLSLFVHRWSRIYGRQVRRHPGRPSFLSSS